MAITSLQRFWGAVVVGKVLVTGGAGYIGSHVVRQLGEAGHGVVVLDNLSTGFEEAVLHGELVVGDTGDQALVASLVEQHDVDTVMHFAAKIVVPESVSDPIKYYRNNTENTLKLLEACTPKVKHFVFSSTAAVYGMPDDGRASEASPTAPINPYGWSKLMSEQMIRDLGAASDLRYVILRYFNVAGADPSGRIGQATPQATHLLKVLCELATGKREQVTVFGTDYDTSDGTCIRDYIHVEDLASAHLCALDHLQGGGESQTLNCGYGRGLTVREVIAAVEAELGQALGVGEGPRRAGDPPVIVAVADQIREVLNWAPKHQSLEGIVGSALCWERKLSARADAASDTQVA